MASTEKPLFLSAKAKRERCEIALAVRDLAVGQRLPWSGRHAVFIVPRMVMPVDRSPNAAASWSRV